MPRLTKKQQIDLYGRNLPTPSIDMMRMSDVTTNDQVYLDHETMIENYGTLTDDEGVRFSRTSHLAAPDYLDRLVRVDLSLSFYMSTWEGFTPEELTKELFQRVNSNDGADNQSLFINVVMSQTPSSEESRRISRRGMMGLFRPDSNPLKSILDALPPGSISYENLGRYAASIGAVEQNTVSLPLSDFFSTIEYTAELDADENTIIKVSNINVPMYVRDINDIDNLTFFAVASTNHPLEIGGSAKLDPISYSLNFSDITYEDLIKNRTLATYGDPVYVDADSVYYPNPPLLGLNSKYYKTDDFGSSDIVRSVNGLLSEYAQYRSTDEELDNAISEAAFTVQENGSAIDFIPRLNQVAQVFSETAELTRTSRFYDRMRILINNADSTLRNQEEVVKRVYRNYKVVDGRALVVPEFDAFSYIGDLKQEDFLYDRFLHTNVANYVPIQGIPSSYPGKAELPASPSERIQEFSEGQEAARRRIATLLRADINSAEITDTGIGSDAGLIGKMISAFTNWVYYNWTPRFIQGSEHQSYRDSTTHDGAHYYIAYNFNPSPDKQDTTIMIDSSKWNNSRDEPDEDDKRAPMRFRDMIRKNSPDAGFGGAVHDPDKTRNLFGYYPASVVERVGDVYKDGYKYDGAYGIQRTTERPDGTAAWDHPVRDDTGYTLGGESDHENEISYMDPFFWTAVKPSVLYALQTLLQQKNQIWFFVPRREFPNSTDPTLSSLEDFDSDPGIPLTGGTVATDYETASELGNKYYDWIGGISALWDNTRESYGRGMNSGGVPLGSEYANGSHAKNPGWLRVSRKKQANIRNQISDLLLRTFGVDPDTGMGSPAAHLDDVDATSTNVETRIDEYLQNMPGVISESIIEDLFTSLDVLSPEAVNTPAELIQWSQIYTDSVFVNLEKTMDEYLDNKLCRIYAVTCYPDPSRSDIQRTVAKVDFEAMSDTDQGYYNVTGDIVMRNVEWVQQNPLSVGYKLLNSRGEQIPFGLWNLGPLQYQRAEFGEDLNKNVFSYTFGDDLKELIRAQITSRRDDIKTAIQEYLFLRGAFDGLKSDTGIHSALAEFDIVLKKYGYFFFDMEKYIRKESIMSKFINVDRLLAYLPSAKDITNSAVRFRSVRMKLDNFGDPATGFTRDHAELTLSKDISTDLNQGIPTRFSEMEFYTPSKPDGTPYVYSQIKAVQNITFDQITEYTNVRDLVSAGSPSIDLDGATTVQGLGPGYAGETSSPENIDLIGIAPFVFDDGTSDSTEGSFDVQTQYGQSTAAAAAALNLQSQLIKNGEVNVEGLLNDPIYAPQNLYTGITIRNYAFPNFPDGTLPYGQNWKKDYRLMCFNYQFFMDDDLAFSFAEDEELNDGINSVDSIEVRILIEDKSYQVISAMYAKYVDVFKVFEDEYYEFAKENCAFDAYSQQFNRFFVEVMMSRFPDAVNSPWYRMVATYTLFLNIFTDTYGGDQRAMEEAANNLLETTRPETGNLGALMELFERAKLMNDALKEASVQVRSADNNIQNYSGGLKQFKITKLLASPVIDHIGDYTEQEEDPRYSLFEDDPD